MLVFGTARPATASAPSKDSLFHPRACHKGTALFQAVAGRGCPAAVPAPAAAAAAAGGAAAAAGGAAAAAASVWAGEEKGGWLCWPTPQHPRLKSQCQLVCPQ